MKKILLALFVFAFSLNTFAHEYWFEPDKFFLAPGEATPLRLFVGDGLVKDQEERVYQPEKTVSFRLFSSNNLWNLMTATTAGAKPVYQFTGQSAGNYLIAMERNWTHITIEADKFEDYLKADGMDFISVERAKRGETKMAGKERYSRFIKGLVQVGDKQDSTYKKKLGLKLELIPMSNPYKAKVGSTIAFQILFDGKPLADRVVFADNRESETQRMTTDKNGKFSFKIGKPGLWLARMVTMRRCETDCGGADWESFWGAYSFGVK
ncbi:MAG: DUF4198 domain-containing protein [Pyrinomonadaceae bacterium]